MTFLAPALLALGAAVVVPLLLHLLQRHQGPRVLFPALRYLRRAEREHATRIRLRQILLLALRVLALLLLAAAAARPFVRGAGQGHPPTAVVLVLDNSLSTSAVVGDRRVLDELKEAALETVATLGPDDRAWLIRAGSPWEPAVTGDAATVTEAVRRTPSGAGAADLTSELERAFSILALEPEVRAREVHLLSDLQATSFRPRTLPAGGDEAAAPFVVVYAPAAPAPPNRAVGSVEIAGGLAPRAERRSTVAVTLSGSDGRPGDSVAVRLVLEGSVRAAGWARPGAAVVLPFPALPAGRVTGHVEIDPDAVAADDRRYFVTEAAPPTPVAVSDAHSFLEEAVTVLEEAGRIRRVPVRDARVVLAPGARAAEAVRRDASAVVMPPATALELPATNQRLSAAGIPWRYAPPRVGEARPDATGSALAATLAGVRLRQVYGLIGEAGDSVTLRLQDGEPWAVSGRAADGGRFLLLASPLTVEGGTIPTSAAMVPFLDRVITGWAEGTADEGGLTPGAIVTVAEGDSVAGPEGTESVREGSVYRLRGPGVYRVLSGTDSVAAYAVNPATEESRLTRLAPERVADRLPGLGVAVAGPDDWPDTIFRDRLGREITPWLLLGAVLLLILEMMVSASGRTGTRTPAAARSVTPAAPAR